MTVLMVPTVPTEPALPGAFRDELELMSTEGVQMIPTRVMMRGVPAPETQMEAIRPEMFAEGVLKSSMTVMARVTGEETLLVRAAAESALLRAILQIL